MSLAEADRPRLESSTHELKGLGRAIKSLDGALLRFNRAVQEVQGAVASLSDALQEITSFTAKLQLQYNVEEFSGLCASIRSCVAAVQPHDPSARPSQTTVTQATVHNDLEALRARTDLLAACEKRWRRTRDKYSKYVSSNSAKKQQAYLKRLGDMTTQLRELQRTYEYELPSTLSDALHRAMKDNAQFCRSLGTTLLCCDAQTRRYAEALRRPSATSNDHGAAAPALTEEQQKGVALQLFARNFFISDQFSSPSVRSLSVCSDAHDTPVSGADGTTGVDVGSGCGCRDEVRRPKSRDSLLWSPVNAISALSQLHNVPPDTPPALGLREGEVCSEAETSFAALREYPWQTPESPVIEEMAQRGAVPPQGCTRATRCSSVPPSLGPSLVTLDALLQLEKDKDCPF